MRKSLCFFLFVAIAQIFTNTAVLIPTQKGVKINGFVTLNWPQIYSGKGPVTCVQKEELALVCEDEEIVAHFWIEPGDQIRACFRIRAKASTSHREKLAFTGKMLYSYVPGIEARSSTQVLKAESVLPKGYFLVSDYQDKEKYNGIIVRTDRAKALVAGYSSTVELWLNGNQEYAKTIKAGEEDSFCLLIEPVFVLDKPLTKNPPPRKLWPSTYSRFSYLLGELPVNTKVRRLVSGLLGRKSAVEIAEIVAKTSLTLPEKISALREAGIPAKVGVDGQRKYLVVYTGKWRVFDEEGKEVEAFPPKVEPDPPVVSSVEGVNLTFLLQLAILICLTAGIVLGAKKFLRLRRKEKQLQLLSEVWDGKYEILNESAAKLPLEREIVRYLKERKELHVKEVAKELEVSEEILKSALKSLVERGAIKKVP